MTTPVRGEQRMLRCVAGSRFGQVEQGDGFGQERVGPSDDLAGTVEQAARPFVGADAAPFAGERPTPFLSS